MRRDIRDKYRLPEALDLQEMGAELRIYGEIEGDMRNFNPSIAWLDDKLMIAIRSCNFMVKRHGDWYLRDGSAYSKTDVILGEVDPKTLEVRVIRKLPLSSNTPTRVKVAGLEDVRLFIRKGKLMAVGFESDRLTKSLHNASASMAVYEIGEELKYVETLEKPVKETVEKNWCPPDVESKLFDYTYSPTQAIKDGKLIGGPTMSQIHGGSILLKQKDGTYLSLVHEKKADKRLGKVYDRFVYYTYLARHDKQGMITHLTPPFRFGTLENIEFAAGLVEHEEDFIMSFGIRDCKYGLARISKEKLTNLLEPWEEE